MVQTIHNLFFTLLSNIRFHNNIFQSSRHHGGVHSKSGRNYQQFYDLQHIMKFFPSRRNDFGTRQPALFGVFCLLIWVRWLSFVHPNDVLDNEDFSQSLKSNKKTFTTRMMTNKNNADQKMKVRTGIARKNTTFTSPPIHHPICNPRQSPFRFSTSLKDDIDEIYFLHMRKAGGTAIGGLLRHVSDKYNISLRESEGDHRFHSKIRKIDNGEYNTSDHTHYSPRRKKYRVAKSLRITHLRSPDARTISHYKYDQRWSCDDTQLLNKTFFPTENNTISTLEDFISKEGGFFDNHSRMKTAPFFPCATNCYTRWVTGQWPKLQNLKHNVADRLVQRAKSALLQFDLIIVSEWLDDPKYVQALHEYFGVYEMSLSEKRLPFCGRESAAANGQVHLTITNESMNLVHASNAYDSRLYNDLTTCLDGNVKLSGKSLKLGGNNGDVLDNFEDFEKTVE